MPKDDTETRIQKVEAENRTAIGAGLARAVAMLHRSRVKSRVVVLLTDGEENGKDILPLDAARAVPGADSQTG